MKRHPNDGHALQAVVDNELEDDEDEADDLPNKKRRLHGPSAASREGGTAIEGSSGEEAVIQAPLKDVSLGTWDPPRGVFAQLNKATERAPDTKISLDEDFEKLESGRGDLLESLKGAANMPQFGEKRRHHKAPFSCRQSQRPTCPQWAPLALSHLCHPHPRSTMCSRKFSINLMGTLWVVSFGFILVCKYVTTVAISVTSEPYATWPLRQSHSAMLVSSLTVSRNQDTVPDVIAEVKPILVNKVVDVVGRIVPATSTPGPSKSDGMAYFVPESLCRLEALKKY